MHVVVVLGPITVPIFNFTSGKITAADKPLRRYTSKILTHYTAIVTLCLNIFRKEMPAHCYLTFVALTTDVLPD